MIKEFREFLLRGNVVDLAVAVVIGAAFGAVVTSFVNDVLMQIVAIVFGEPNFGGLTITINDSEIRYGSFLNTIISFVIIGFVLFLIVKAFNAMLEAARRQGREDEINEPGEDVMLLREIRDSLRMRG